MILAKYYRQMNPLLGLGAGFEPFVHEEVEPVVDVEPQVVQLVG
jgi:hypothetical protein